MTGERLGSALLARPWALRTLGLRRGGRAQVFAALFQLLLTLAGLEAGAKNDFSLVSRPSSISIPTAAGGRCPVPRWDAPHF